MAGAEPPAEPNPNRLTILIAVTEEIDLTVTRALLKILIEARDQRAETYKTEPGMIRTCKPSPPSLNDKAKRLIHILNPWTYPIASL